MPAEFAFLVPLASAIVGAAIALVVMRSNQQQQLKQDALEDERALRDAKRARLASVYEIALTALVAMNHFVSMQHLGQRQMRS